MRSLKKENVINNGDYRARIFSQKIWLRLLFIKKCIKIIFFYFFKIIFDISASKLSKNTKKNIKLKQKKIKKF